MLDDSADATDRGKKNAAAPAAAPPLADLSLLILVALVAFCLCVVLSILFRDGDTGWHVAAGAWMIDHQAVPHRDPFSFTAYGRPWVAHEWLTEVLMYGAWRIAGWSGVALLFGIALVALEAIVFLYARRWQRLRTVALTMIYMTIGILPSLLARPHVLALPVLALWLVGLLKAREQGTAPPLALATLMILWANLHGSFIFGLALAGFFALEAFVQAPPAERRNAFLGWLLFGVVSVAATLVNPNGIAGLLHPFHLIGMKSLAFIAEWKPSSFGSVGAFEIVLLTTLFFLLYCGVKIPPLRLLLLLGVLHLALSQMRQQMILSVVGALILAEPFGRALAKGAAVPRPALARRIWRDRRELAPILAIGCLLFAALTAYRLAVPFRFNSGTSAPETAIDHLPAALRTQPVFNEYSFGGWLIYKGIRPYIDGRNDMYGDAFTEEYVKIADGDAARWRAAERKWRFGWIIMPPESALVKLVSREPGWRRLYADKNAVILVSDRAGLGRILGPGGDAQPVGQVHAP